MQSKELYHSTLSSVPVRHLIRYLTSCDWTQIEFPRLTDISVMRKTFGSREEEIVIPRDVNFSDYHERMFDAVHSLSEFENRNLDDIIDELLAIGSDVLRIRISGGNVGNGKIPFLDEMAIKDGLKKVLSATACHVLDPRPFYKKLHRTEAEQLLRNCQLGQPEHGSYIIKFYFPVLDSLDTSINKDRPFARLVTEHLMISLKDLVSFVQHDKSHSLPQNLNANLCFGLVEMPGDSKVDLDFQMSWSEEVSIDSKVPREVKIHNNYISEISKIGEILKPQQETTQSDFIGKISILSGSENEQGDVEGDITLVLLVDDDTKKAKASLNPKFYRQACDAHINGNYVKISGLLKEKPRLSILENINTFEVIAK